MPVIIRISGRPEVWGSPRLGLSSSEKQEYDDLYARHRQDEVRLHEMLGSGSAYMRKHFRRQLGVSVNPQAIQKVVRLCQDLEATRRALRGFLADPNPTVERAWRSWVDRELAEMRSGGNANATAERREWFNPDTFSLHSALSSEQRDRAEGLLEEWRRVTTQIQSGAVVPEGGERAGDHSVRDNGPDLLPQTTARQLRARLDEIEDELRVYSADSAIGDPALPVDEGDRSAVGADDALDYSLPYLPPRDLILEARRRMKRAPRNIAFQDVSPEYWQGEHEDALRQRFDFVSWPRSVADPDRLLALGWPPGAIGVWCYPYLYDVHLHDSGSPEQAAEACLKRLRAEVWPLSQVETTDLGHHVDESKAADLPLIGRDAEFVRLWRELLTAAQIAERFSLDKKTVANRIGYLRALYGSEVVPYRRTQQ